MCVCQFSWCLGAHSARFQESSLSLFVRDFLSSLSPVSEVNRNCGGVGGADCWCRGNVLVFREFQNSIVTVVTIVSEAMVRRFGSRL